MQKCKQKQKTIAPAFSTWVLVLLLTSCFLEIFSRIFLKMLVKITFFALDTLFNMSIVMSKRPLKVCKLMPHLVVFFGTKKQFLANSTSFNWVGTNCHNSAIVWSRDLRFCMIVHIDNTHIPNHTKPNLTKPNQISLKLT